MAVKVGSMLVPGLFSASLRVLLSQDPPDDSCLENDERCRRSLLRFIGALHSINYMTSVYNIFIDSGLVMYSEDVLDLCSC